MAYIREIRYYDHVDESSALSKASNCVCDMFVRWLGVSLKTAKVQIVNIYITGNKQEHLSYELVSGIIHIDYYLTRGTGEGDTTNFERKKAVLDIIFEVLKHLAAREKWNTKLISDTYNACLNKGISNEWWQGKPIVSPNRQYSVGVYYCYDINGFETFLALFDENKKELKRHLICKQVFDGYLIERVSWRNNSTFFITFSGQRKQFAYTINDFLKSKIKLVSSKMLEASR